MLKQFARGLHQAVVGPLLDTVAGPAHEEARQPSSAPIGWQTRGWVRDATRRAVARPLQEAQQDAQIGIRVFQQFPRGR
eukprot:7999780-Alexandrium_andersonii.AAC.1